uniref:Uncharacterized protein n=1 Tax=Anguilla anguilla TaxID=7936 RepID=A0A0E9WK40_ANGAN
MNRYKSINSKFRKKLKQCTANRQWLPAILFHSLFFEHKYLQLEN